MAEQLVAWAWWRFNLLVVHFNECRQHSSRSSFERVAIVSTTKCSSLQPTGTSELLHAASKNPRIFLAILDKSHYVCFLSVDLPRDHSLLVRPKTSSISRLGWISLGLKDMYNEVVSEERRSVCCCYQNFRNTVVRRIFFQSFRR